MEPINNFICKSNPSDADPDEVQRLSLSTGLHPKLVELLVLRNIRTEADIKSFIEPNEENLHDPFLLKGMREAIARINAAIEENQRIVIFGDYDADGICSTAILSLYLSGFDLDVYAHIPNRNEEGYGLNIESLERIIEESNPDLIITCDCGISGKDEVDYVLDLGIDVIVTDHHEISGSIPDCIVINPKQEDCDYPINYLCGAGVVLKLVQAHGGLPELRRYCDLAALATIADLVPLTGENRLIVQLGLERFKERRNLGLKFLLEDLGISGCITSSDIAYKISPRINAAGRVGDAYRAFELLTSNDVSYIKKLIKDINDDNTRRKAQCDVFYLEALEIIRNQNLIGCRSIVISHPDWEKGIVGIVAARLANEFCRPVFILVKSGDSYKGTSRSIPDINIYELLEDSKDLLIEFGGHSQAAGFSILEENIEAFRRKTNEYLVKYKTISFLPRMRYDTVIVPDEANLALAKSLTLLEPYGNGNHEPLFKLRAKNIKISNCNNPAHTCAVIDGKLTAYAFNSRRTKYLFFGDDIKDVILEIRLNRYKEKESISGIIKACIPEVVYINDTVSMSNFLKYLNYKESANPLYKFYKSQDLREVVGENIFGTLIIAGCEQSYQRFLNNINLEFVVAHEFLNALLKNNYTRVIISPDFDDYLLLSNYSKVVFLDRPLNLGIVSFLNKNTKAEVFLPEEDNRKIFLERINLERSTFGQYFEMIKENEKLSVDNLYSYGKILKSRYQGFEMEQLVVCMSVFIDLDLIIISKDPFKVSARRDVRTDLNNSKTYKDLKEILANK